MLAPEWKLFGRYLVFLSLVITMGCSLTWPRWNSYCTSADLMHAAWHFSEWVALLPGPGEIVAVCWAWACCLAFLKMIDIVRICWACACCLAFLRMGYSVTWPRWNSYNLLSSSMLLGIHQIRLLSYLTQVK
jgi:hypothetical protein